MDFGEDIANSKENIETLFNEFHLMKKKSQILIPLLAVVMLLSASCMRQPTDSSTSGLITLMCDHSFENIIQQEIDVFEYTYPNANIIPYYIDAHAAIDSLLDQKTSLIVTAQELTKEQRDYLENVNKFPPRTQRIAVDAIAVIANPENDIDELSISELRDILSGKTPRWGDVFPSKLGKIQVIFDHQGSSVVKYITDSIMKGEKFTTEVYAADSVQQVFTEVQKRKNAIGLIGVSWITADMQAQTTTIAERMAELQKNDTVMIDFTDKIKVMKIRRDNQIEAFKPYQAYIYDGSYPLYRSIYVTTTEPNGSLSHGFYSFLTGFIGQKIILNTGVMPASVHPRLVTLN